VSTCASLQNATAVATTSLDDLAAQTVAGMAAAALAVAAAQRSNVSVFATAADYDAELQLIAANKYTLEENYRRRHGASCGDALTSLNRGPIHIDEGVVLPPRWASVPDHASGICHHNNRLVDNVWLHTFH
jgi:hypothetical protein